CPLNACVVPGPGARETRQSQWPQSLAAGDRSAAGKGGAVGRGADLPRPGPPPPYLACSGLLDEAELTQCGDPVVEADLLGDKAVFDLQHGDPSESHHLAGAGRQFAERHVVERRAGVRAAAFPLADHVVALGDQVGGAPEVQVRERGAELSRELADRLSAAQRRVQRVLEPDVRGGELVDDGGVVVLAPELGEPAADDGLVLLDRHRSFPSLPWVSAAPCSVRAHPADGQRGRLVRRRRGISVVENRQGPGAAPAWSTRSHNWCRPAMPSFGYDRYRREATVQGDRYSRSAISPLVRPRLARMTISCCCGVSAAVRRRRVDEAAKRGPLGVPADYPAVPAGGSRSAHAAPRDDLPPRRDGAAHRAGGRRRPAVTPGGVGGRGGVSRTRSEYLYGLSRTSAASSTRAPLPGRLPGQRQSRAVASSAPLTSLRGAVTPASSCRAACWRALRAPVRGRPVSRGAGVCGAGASGSFSSRSRSCARARASRRETCI